VAVASRGEHPFFGRDEAAREPSNAFFDYVFSVSLAVGVIGLGIAVWGLIASRGGDLETRRKQTKLIGTLFICGLIVGFALASRFIDVNLQSLRGEGFSRNAGRTTSTATGPNQAARDPYSPDFQWLPVLLLVGAGVGTWVAFREAGRRRKRRARGTSDEAFVGELATLLDDTLDDLRAEPDPRRAVIAAYARTERALGGYGFPRRPFEAPLEYLDRIAAPLHERQPSARRLVFELTHLFERAKFSSHAIDAEMKDDAIRTLAALRDELREPEAA
jgi:hypothetical protein